MRGKICQPVCQIENRKNDWKNDSGNHINSFRPRWRQLVLGKPPVDTRRTAGVGNKLFFSIFIGSFISENHAPYFSKMMCELKTDRIFTTLSPLCSLTHLHWLAINETITDDVIQDILDTNSQCTK